MFNNDDLFEIDYVGHSGLATSDRTFLYNFIIKHKCLNVLEIGLAHGMSSVAILSALAENSKELSSADFKLTSIDPFQTCNYKLIGLKNIDKIGLLDHHELIESTDMLALPKLLEKGVKYDLIFIDGMHTFDHVLLNNFYADYLLNVGGFVINDDIWMPSIQKVCAYLSANYTHYQIVEDYYPRFAPIYKKISDKNIEWTAFTMF